MLISGNYRNYSFSLQLRPSLSVLHSATPMSNSTAPSVLPSHDSSSTQESMTASSLNGNSADPDITAGTNLKVCVWLPWFYLMHMDKTLLGRSFCHVIHDHVVQLPQIILLILEKGLRYQRYQINQQSNCSDSVFPHLQTCSACSSLSFYDQVVMLMDVFPSLLEVEAYQHVMEYGLEDAILHLSSNDPTPSGVDVSLASVLSQYARSVLVPGRDFLISLRRDEIWPKDCQLYQAAKVDERQLRWNLVVEYEREGQMLVLLSRVIFQ